MEYFGALLNVKERLGAEFFDTGHNPKSQSISQQFFERIPLVANSNIEF